MLLGRPEKPIGTPLPGAEAESGDRVLKGRRVGGTWQCTSGPDSPHARATSLKLSLRVSFLYIGSVRSCVSFS